MSLNRRLQILGFFVLLLMLACGYMLWQTKHDIDKIPPTTPPSTPAVTGGPTI